MKLIEKYSIYILIAFVICMFLKPIFCFLILGSLVLYSGFEELKFLKKIDELGIRTNGKILKYTRGSGSYQTPTIVFTTIDGKIIEKEPSSYSATDINKFRSFSNFIGKSINVKYNPKNPEEFLIDDERTFNTFSIYFMIFVGSVFSLVAILNIFGLISINWR